jgi:hypothetical protein
MSYVDEEQRSRRGFAAGRSGKGIFRGALYLGTGIFNPAELDNSATVANPLKKLKNRRD